MGGRGKQAWQEVNIFVHIQHTFVYYFIQNEHNDLPYILSKIICPL